MVQKYQRMKKTIFDYYNISHINIEQPNEMLDYIESCL